MAVNRTAIANMLRPGLNAVVTVNDMYEAEYPQIFTRNVSNKGTEIDVEIRLTGVAPFRPEGSPTVFDNQLGQRTVTNYVNRYVSIGFAITHAAMQDNLYKDYFPDYANSLKDSLLQAREINGASILNNGFNAAFPIGDGQPVFSLNHPIDGGVQANRPAVFSDLNEASAEQGIIAVQLYKNPANLVVKTMVQKLVVGPQNQMVASRLCNSPYRIGTPNNDISAIHHDKLIPKGYVVNHFITPLPGGLNSWFFITNARQGFKHFVRMEPETDVYADFHTDNLLCKATERYCFGVTDWRAGWGNHG